MLRRLGFEGIIWFNSANWAFAAICLTIIWKTSSFMALIILAGLQTIPRSLYEAAEVDGAGRMRQFFEITLPLLKPSIVVALIFRTITALQTFDIPFTMTRGGPDLDRDARHVYPPEHGRLPRSRLWLGARGGHVRALHVRDRGLPAHDPRARDDSHEPPDARQPARSCPASRCGS